MLSNQAKRQGGFFVCASCRRQQLQQQSLARLRLKDHNRKKGHLSTSRPFSSTTFPITVALAPGKTRLENVRPSDRLSQPTAALLNKRGYASWDKFGPNKTPGQTNAAWGAAMKNNEGPGKLSSAWTGAALGAKIPPAVGTSAWAGNIGNGVAPARSTAPTPSPVATPNPNDLQTMADTARSTPSAGYGSSFPTTKTSNTNSPPFARASELERGGRRIPSRDLANTRFGKSEFGGTWDKPRGRSAFEASSSLPTSSSSRSDVMGFEPLQSRRSNVQFSARDSLSPRHQPRAQSSDYKLPSGRLSDNSFSRRPSRPAPQGAEFPQLRRRGSRDELFESMSPFDLPNRSTSPQPDSAATDPGDGRARPTYADQPIRNKPGKSSNIESRASKKNSSRDDEEWPSGLADVPIPSYTKFEGSMTAEQFSQAMSASTPASPRRVEIRASTSPREAPPWTASENSRYSRPSTERRVRGWDLGEDKAESPAYDRRGKGGKPKNVKYRSRELREDDEDDGDYEFDFEEEMIIREQRRRHREEKRVAKEAAAPKSILLPEYITVYDLAEALRVKPAQFLRDLEQLGFENILHDSVMTGETAALVAAEYGLEPTIETGGDVDLVPRPPAEDPSSLPPRPPIVTIMGHVDHGKTTILDFLRKSSVAAQEAGGITQHIGAFSVKLTAGKTITFLDTPGHAAFLTMRQRGANVTDIVVLVVAVDDSVKPQTIEAIKHAQSAQVPIIVAVNKVDLDPSRVGQVKQDLAAHDVEIEDFGGDVQVVAISGKTGQGMKDLEEAILTLSEILDVRAEHDGMAEGWVLESGTKQDGKAATVLVKRGTLRVGDLIVAGSTYTKIRIMKNEAGNTVEQATPGTPVEIYGGWKDPPTAGDMVLQAPDESRAQAAVHYRQDMADRALAASQKAQEELADREKAEREALEKMMEEEAEEGGEDGTATEPADIGPKLVNIIVRGDVMGSVEAVCGSIQEIGNNEVQPRILRSAAGQITESDVDLAATAKGLIVNFNNTIPAFLLRRADDAGVRIMDHRIIYEVVDEVRAEMSKLLKPIYSIRVLAEAEVLQVFPINIVKRKFKNIAGVKVKSGTVMRNGLYRVVRQGDKIHDGKLDALKQVKKNVAEVRRGNECGMMFEDFDQFEVGDVIQLYENVEEKRYL